MTRTVVATALAIWMSCGLAEARPLEPGVRIGAGGGLALDPPFAVAAIAADHFVTRSLGFGLLAVDGFQPVIHRAVESRFTHLNVVARFRAQAHTHLHGEAFIGLGTSRFRFGSPGAHTAWTPNLAFGIGASTPLPAGFAVGIEAVSHVTFDKEMGARNAPESSTLVLLLLRWGP